MTMADIASTWEPGRCPACLSTASCTLRDDLMLCFDCRHEWAPSTTTGPLPGASITKLPVPEPMEMPADDVPAPGHEPNPIDQARATMIGREAMWFDAGARGTITEITDAGAAVIEFGSGYAIVAEPDEFDILPDTTPPDAVVVDFGEQALTCAQRIMFAAVETFTHDDEGDHLGIPPTEYLTNDPETFWITEAGAAYAVAALAYAVGIAPAQLAAIAEQIVIPSPTNESENG